MNTYVIVLNNGAQINIKADDFERSAETICFIDFTRDLTMAIFRNDGIAGLYLKQYEA